MVGSTVQIPIKENGIARGDVFIPPCTPLSAGLEPGNTLPLTACKTRLTFSGLIVAPGYEAGTPFHTAVKTIPAPVGITAHIAHLTFCQLHQFRVAGACAIDKFHAGQVLRTSRIWGTAAKQQRLITQRLAINLIHLQLLGGQKLRCHSGNGLAGEFHIQNVILIGDFLRSGLAGLRVCGSFCAVANLHFLRKHQLILCRKYTHKLCLRALPCIALQDGR